MRTLSIAAVLVVSLSALGAEDAGTSDPRVVTRASVQFTFPEAPKPSVYAPNRTKARPEPLQESWTLKVGRERWKVTRHQPVESFNLRPAGKTPDNWIDALWRLHANKQRGVAKLEGVRCGSGRRYLHRAWDRREELGFFIDDHILTFSRVAPRDEWAFSDDFDAFVAATTLEGKPLITGDALRKCRTLLEGPDGAATFGSPYNSKPPEGPPPAKGAAAETTASRAGWERTYAEGVSFELPGKPERTTTATKTSFGPFERVSFSVKRDEGLEDWRARIHKFPKKMRTKASDAELFDATWRGGLGMASGVPDASFVPVTIKAPGGKKYPGRRYTATSGLVATTAVFFLVDGTMYELSALYGSRETPADLERLLGSLRLKDQPGILDVLSPVP